MTLQQMTAENAENAENIEYRTRNNELRSGFRVPGQRIAGAGGINLLFAIFD